MSDDGVSLVPTHSILGTHRSSQLEQVADLISPSMCAPSRVEQNAESFFVDVAEMQSAGISAQDIAKLRGAG